MSATDETNELFDFENEASTVLLEMWQVDEGKYRYRVTTKRRADHELPWVPVHVRLFFTYDKALAYLDDLIEKIEHAEKVSN